MLYRPYHPQDFPALYAIEEICFRPPERFSRAYMRRLTRKKDAAIWIAEREERMLGFAIADWGGEAGNPLAYIQTLEVLPDARGQGVGTELLRRIEGSVKEAEVRAIWLHVDAENAAAIRVYANGGYQMLGCEEGYYGANRSALVYGKLLGSNLETG